MLRLLVILAGIVFMAPAMAACPTVPTDCTATPVNKSVTAWQGFVGGPWTTSGRPLAPATGQTGFNSTLGTYETWSGSAWVLSAAPAGSLTGTTLASNVVNSSLVTVSLGTLGTASIAGVGTSGHVLPYLDGANTWSGLGTFNNGTTTYGFSGENYGFSPNNTPGATLGFLYQGNNKGPAVGIGIKEGYNTWATGTGFDAGHESVCLNSVSVVGNNRPAYYCQFNWIFGPSDTATSWGLGFDETDISNLVPTTPGWAVGRTAGPQTSGAHLVAAIATSSIQYSLSNPFTTNGTTTVTVTFPSTGPNFPHLLQVGQTVTFSGSGITGCNGFLPANPSTYTVLSVIDAYNFTINGGATSGSGTCGGAVIAQEFNGTDIRYAYAVGPSVDVNAATGRFARQYTPFNSEPNALVGAGIDPNGRGGAAYTVSGAGWSLVTNPVTTNNTSTVSVAWANSGLLTTGARSTFIIAGAATVGGYNPNGTHTATSVTATTVQYTDAGASGSNTTGGGASVMAYGTADVPNAAVDVPQGALVNGLNTSGATLTNVIKAAAGQAIIFTGTGSVGYQGTNTNDSAGAGFVGELIANSAKGGETATVTITIAAPGAVTDTAHGLQCLSPIYLSTSGALPTGLSTFTPYYLTCGTVTTNTYQLSSSIANAVAGTAITTTGTQSGTQTVHRAGLMNLGTGAPFDVAGVQLTAGNYSCVGIAQPLYGGANSVTALAAWVGTAGGSTMPYSATTPSVIEAGQAAGLNSSTFSAVTTPAAVISTMPVNIKLASPGIAVLSFQAAWTTSSMSVSGTINCTRIR